jgi:ACT domain-containing protein
MKGHFRKFSSATVSYLLVHCPGSLYSSVVLKTFAKKFKNIIAHLKILPMQGPFNSSLRINQDTHEDHVLDKTVAAHD